MASFDVVNAEQESNGHSLITEPCSRRGRISWAENWDSDWPESCGDSSGRETIKKGLKKKGGYISLTKSSDHDRLPSPPCARNGAISALHLLPGPGQHGDMFRAKLRARPRRSQAPLLQKHQHPPARPSTLPAADSRDHQLPCGGKKTKILRTDECVMRASSQKRQNWARSKAAPQPRPGRAGSRREDQEVECGGCQCY